MTIDPNATYPFVVPTATTIPTVYPVDFITTATVTTTATTVEPTPTWTGTNIGPWVTGEPWPTEKGQVITISTATPLATVSGNTSVVVVKATVTTLRPGSTPGVVVTRVSTSPGMNIPMPDLSLVILVVIVLAIVIVGAAAWRVRGIEEKEEEDLFATDDGFGDEIVDDLDDYDGGGGEWIDAGDDETVTLLPPDDDLLDAGEPGDEEIPEDEFTEDETFEDDEDAPLRND